MADPAVLRKGRNMDEKILETRKKIVYDFICDALYVPMKIKEMAQILQVPKEEKQELKEILDALIAEGKINVSQKGRYSKGAGRGIRGIFEGNARGFGFVIPEAGGEDIFIPANAQNGALHKDLVEALPTPGREGRRQEGMVVKILARGVTELVGTFERHKNFGFVIPDDKKISKDIFVPLERSKGAASGQKVVAAITDYGGKNRKPEGKVKEILGHLHEPGVGVLSIVREHGLPMEFPEEVQQMAKSVPRTVDVADFPDRLDLRDLQTVTIDGEDAKDLDDAITISREGDLFTLGVHIADVAHYVTERSLLDAEALQRGTSVYLVDRVIPMLPRELSNGICSLNAGCDRLALSCIMKIDGKGHVRDHRIAETLINVDRRMTYTSVKKILTDQDQEEREQYREFLEMFSLMEELAAILRRKRRQRGSIDFDIPETKVILDERGRPVEIRPYDRNVATKIIEEFMLAANETVAQDYFWRETPFVYRTHEKPEGDKIRALGLFINNFGYAFKLGGEAIHPKELQKLLEKIEDTPEEALLSRLTLRAMKRARYTTENTGHFGLAAENYCHFTSPIRRYPDLQIHRIIKEDLRGKLQGKRLLHYEKILPEVAKRSSDLERRAEEAERDTVKLKKVEFMEGKIGQAFEGIISGMNAYGIYVELPDTVEGMVHVSSIKDDHYLYDEVNYEMVGEHTNKRYKLGQKARVVLTGTDRMSRTIDFVFAGQE